MAGDSTSSAGRNHPPQELTEDQLRAAWRDRRRLGWPHTYEASIAHPILSRIITMHARHVLKMQATDERRAAEWFPTEPPPDHYEVADMPVTMPTPLELPPRLQQQQRRQLDGKSLASGEKPEPDEV